MMSEQNCSIVMIEDLTLLEPERSRIDKSLNVLSNAAQLLQKAGRGP
jgi:hypothetical protein